MVPLIHPVLNDSIYIAQGVDYLPETQSFRIFKPDPDISYFPLCDDFGPMNMACVARFAVALEKEIISYPCSRIFYCAEEGSRNMTNAAFLLGSYLILMRNCSLEEVIDCFGWLEEHHYEEYRDATFSKPTFRLTLEDCWGGLIKGKSLGWVGRPDADGFCGKLDMREYAHYDDPLNGDLHEVVPDKLFAFVGPHDLGPDEYQDDARGRRRFGPAFFAGVLADRGASTVVRLNEPLYDGSAFTDRGMRMLDLPFEDCAPPPPVVAEAFLAAVAEAAGPVGVHCKAGLGRTGTLIALHLMRSHGFTAREAMGWLRIMRPGSVIGEQQHYLVEQERAAAAGPAPAVACVEAPAEGGGRAAAAAKLAEDVGAGMERRAVDRLLDARARAQPARDPCAGADGPHADGGGEGRR